jgi:hypothetical protein
MSLQDELTRAMVDGYRRAGEEVGYWGKRYLQTIRRGGNFASSSVMSDSWLLYQGFFTACLMLTLRYF